MAAISYFPLGQSDGAEHMEDLHGRQLLGDFEDLRDGFTRSHGPSHIALSIALAPHLLHVTDEKPPPRPSPPHFLHVTSVGVYPSGAYSKPVPPQ